MSDDATTSTINKSSERLRPRKKNNNSIERRILRRHASTSGTNDSSPSPLSVLEAVSTPPGLERVKSPLPIETVPSAENLHLCLFCDQTFINIGLLQKHTDRVHRSSGRRGIRGGCTYCGKPEKDPITLFRHIASAHSAQYHACIHCFIRFPTLLILSNHRCSSQDKVEIESPKRSKPRLRQSSRQDDTSTSATSSKVANEKKPSPAKTAQKQESPIFENKIQSTANPTNSTQEQTTEIFLPPVTRNATLLTEIHRGSSRSMRFRPGNKDSTILSRLGIVQRTRSSRSENSRTDGYRQKYRQNANSNSSNFDPEFYLKVANNVRENLQFHLDGELEPRRTRYGHSYPLSDSGFERSKGQLRDCHYDPDYVPTLLAPDQHIQDEVSPYGPASRNLMRKRKWNPTYTGEEPPEKYRMANATYGNFAILDLWTQLQMRQRFNEAHSSMSNGECSSASLRNESQRKTDNAFAEMGLQRAVRVPSPAPVYFSGELTRPQLFACSMCGKSFDDSRSFEAHEKTHQLPAEGTIKEYPFYKLIKSTMVRGSYRCTKCGVVPPYIQLHRHIAECAGDLVRRKVRRRPFGAKRRRLRGAGAPTSRIAFSRTTRARLRSRARPRAPTRPRAVPGDAESIQRMLADLPAKRRRQTVIDAFNNKDKKKTKENADTKEVVMSSNPKLDIPIDNEPTSKNQEISDIIKTKLEVSVNPTPTKLETPGKIKGPLSSHFKLSNKIKSQIHNVKRNSKTTCTSRVIKRRPSHLEPPARVLRASKLKLVVLGQSDDMSAGSSPKVAAKILPLSKRKRKDTKAIHKQDPSAQPSNTDVKSSITAALEVTPLQVTPRPLSIPSKLPHGNNMNIEQMPTIAVQDPAADPMSQMDQQKNISSIQITEPSQQSTTAVDISPISAINTNQPQKITKVRRGLNDCIAMLKNKLTGQTPVSTAESPLDLSGNLTKNIAITKKPASTGQRSGSSKTTNQKPVFDPTLRIPQYKVRTHSNTVTNVATVPPTTLPSQGSSQAVQAPSQMTNDTLKKFTSNIPAKTAKLPSLQMPPPPTVPTPIQSNQPPIVTASHSSLCETMQQLPTNRDSNLIASYSEQLSLLPKAIIDVVKKLIPCQNEELLLKTLPVALAKAVGELNLTKHNAEPDTNQEPVPRTSEIATQTIDDVSCPPEFLNVDTDHFLIDPATGAIAARGPESEIVASDSCTTNKAKTQEVIDLTTEDEANLYKIPLSVSDSQMKHPISPSKVFGQNKPDKGTTSLRAVRKKSLSTNKASTLLNTSDGEGATGSYGHLKVGVKLGITTELLHLHNKTIPIGDIVPEIMPSIHFTSAEPTALPQYSAENCNLDGNVGNAATIEEKKIKVSESGILEVRDSSQLDLRKSVSNIRSLSPSQFDQYCKPDFNKADGLNYEQRVIPDLHDHKPDINQSSTPDDCSKSIQEKSSLEKLPIKDRDVAFKTGQIEIKETESSATTINTATVTENKIDEFLTPMTCNFKDEALQAGKIGANQADVHDINESSYCAETGDNVKETNDEDNVKESNDPTPSAQLEESTLEVVNQLPLSDPPIIGLSDNKLYANVEIDEGQTKVDIGSDEPSQNIEPDIETSLENASKPELLSSDKDRVPVDTGGNVLEENIKVIDRASESQSDILGDDDDDDNIALSLVKKNIATETVSLGPSFKKNKKRVKKTLISLKIKHASTNTSKKVNSIISQNVNRKNSKQNLAKKKNKNRKIKVQHSAQIELSEESDMTTDSNKPLEKRKSVRLHKQNELKTSRMVHSSSDENTLAQIQSELKDNKSAETEPHSNILDIPTYSDLRQDDPPQVERAISVSELDIKESADEQDDDLLKATKAKRITRSSVAIQNSSGGLESVSIPAEACNHISTDDSMKSVSSHNELLDSDIVEGQTTTSLLAGDSRLTSDTVNTDSDTEFLSLKGSLNTSVSVRKSLSPTLSCISDSPVKTLCVATEKHDILSSPITHDQFDIFAGNKISNTNKKSDKIILDAGVVDSTENDLIKDKIKTKISPRKHKKSAPIVANTNECSVNDAKVVNFSSNAQTCKTSSAEDFEALINSKQPVEKISKKSQAKRTIRKCTKKDSLMPIKNIVCDVDIEPANSKIDSVSEIPEIKIASVESSAIIIIDKDLTQIDKSSLSTPKKLPKRKNNKKTKVSKSLTETILDADELQNEYSVTAPLTLDSKMSEIEMPGTHESEKNCKGKPVRRSRTSRSKEDSPRQPVNPLPQETIDVGDMPNDIAGIIKEKTRKTNRIKKSASSNFESKIRPEIKNTEINTSSLLPNLSVTWKPSDTVDTNNSFISSPEVDRKTDEKLPDCEIKATSKNYVVADDLVILKNECNADANDIKAINNNLEDSKDISLVSESPVDSPSKIEKRGSKRLSKLKMNKNIVKGDGDFTTSFDSTDQPSDSMSLFTNSDESGPIRTRQNEHNSRISIAPTDKRRKVRISQSMKDSRNVHSNIKTLKKRGKGINSNSSEDVTFQNICSEITTNADILQNEKINERERSNYKIDTQREDAAEITSVTNNTNHKTKRKGFLRARKETYNSLSSSIFDDSDRTNDTCLTSESDSNSFSADISKSESESSRKLFKRTLNLSQKQRIIKNKIMPMAETAPDMNHSEISHCVSSELMSNDISTKSADALKLTETKAQLKTSFEKSRRQITGDTELTNIDEKKQLEARDNIAAIKNLDKRKEHNIQFNVSKAADFPNDEDKKNETDIKLTQPDGAIELPRIGVKCTGEKSESTITIKTTLKKGRKKNKKQTALGTSNIPAEHTEDISTECRIKMVSETEEPQAPVAEESNFHRDNAHSITISERLKCRNSRNVPLLADSGHLKQQSPRIKKREILQDQCDLEKETSIISPNDSKNTQQTKKQLKKSNASNDREVTASPTIASDEITEINKNINNNLEMESDLPLSRVAQKKNKSNKFELEDNSITSLENQKEKVQLAKTDRRRKTLVACDNTTNSPDPPNEPVFHDSYLENFGIYSERRPRRSNILATKKISETFHLDSSDTDDLTSSNTSPDERITTDEESSQLLDKKEEYSTEDITDNLEDVIAKEDEGDTVNKTNRNKLKLAASSKENDETYCAICKRKFRRPDNLMKHKMTLTHISKLSELEAREMEAKNKKNETSVEVKLTGQIKQKILENNVDQVSREMSPELNENTDVLDNTDSPADLVESSSEAALPLVENELHDLYDNKGSRKKLSHDEKLFFECCSLLKESQSCPLSQSEAVHVNSSDELEININLSPDTTATKILPNRNKVKVNEVTYLDPRETSCDDDDEVCQKLPSDDLMSMDDLKIEKKRAVGSLSEKQKVSNFEIQSILPLDILEDKFDKIKRKSRTAAAAKGSGIPALQAPPSTARRNKGLTKRRKAAPKKISKKRQDSRSNVPTKGALKVFDGIKVSIPTAEIKLPENIQSIDEGKMNYDPSANKWDHISQSGGSKLDLDKRLDVYEFLDDDECNDIPFNHPLQHDRILTTKTGTAPTADKDFKKSPSIEHDDAISQSSIRSGSDLDDFVYMSDDYLNPSEEEESSVSGDRTSIQSRNVSKSTLPVYKREVTEKSAIMGKIFKSNAVRPDRKNPSPKDRKKSSSEVPQDMDELFNSLLDNTKVTLCPKIQIDDADDHNEREIAPDAISLELELSDAVDTAEESLEGVARRRARRKCAAGKQNVLVESWSSESETDRAESGTCSSSEGIRRRAVKRPSVRRSASRTDSSAGPLMVRTHFEQHGWIVGDSHKKLVTMLAHAKGRKRDDKSNKI